MYVGLDKNFVVVGYSVFTRKTVSSRLDCNCYAHSNVLKRYVASSYTQLTNLILQNLGDSCMLASLVPITYLLVEYFH